MTLSILSFALLLIILIGGHELGHFFAAKLCKVRIEKFSIGFGPVLLKYVSKSSQTEWLLSLIPLGGYVKMYGESDDAYNNNNPSYKNEPYSYHSKSPLQKIFIAFSGPLANIIISLVAIVLVFSLEGRIVPSYDTVIKNIMPQSPAQKIGLQTEDKIIKFNNSEITNFDDLRTELNKIPSKKSFETSITILRGQIPITKNITLTNGTLGVAIDTSYVVERKLSYLETIYYGYRYILKTTQQIYYSLISLIQGKEKKENLSGVIKIAQITSEVAHKGLIPYILLLAILSLNLAIINLLPIPILDGGRITIYLIELIIKRPINKKIYNIMNATGVIIVLSLITFTVINDIVNIIRQ